MSGVDDLRRRARRAAGTTRRMVPLAAIAGRRRVVPYVGWIGQGNLGDEAMYEVHRRLFPGVGLASLPPDPVRRLAGGVARLPWLECPAICVGGGTLVGNGHFLNILEVAVGAWPDRPGFALGVGVEDADYQEGNRKHVGRDLDLWAQHLRGYGPVGVRGPLSERTLRDRGVPARMTGDPALLLETPHRPPAGRTLGLNVGRVDDQWGQDPERFYGEVVEFARAAIGDGWTVRLIPTWSGDVTFQRELAERIGHGAVALPLTSIDSTLAAFAECRVVVAHKLHAVVFAACAGVPAVALEYRPKCRDFQESVGRGDWTLRTDRLTADDLRTALAEHDRDRDALASDLVGAVEGRRAALREAAAEIRGVLATA